MERFCKTVVLATIDRLKQGTDSYALWDAFPGIREGRHNALDAARSLAGTKRLTKGLFGTNLRGTANALIEEFRIDLNNGCAQTKGKPLVFVRAYGEYSAIRDLLQAFDL